MLIAIVAGIAKYADVILWSAGLTAIALVGLGWVSKHTLRRLEMSVRRHADEIADVVAIRLAKNPASLGAACAALAANDDRVSPVGWRSELMWFEAVESIDSDDGEYADHVAKANRRSHRELLDRAVDAYATARVPLPDRVGSMLADPAH